MKLYQYFKTLLTELATLQIALDKKGGATEDGDLFEQTVSLQEDILKKFGLPISPDNEQLIWFSQLPTDEEINERVKQLHKTATEYLLTEATSDLATLRNAQELQQDPMYVLPELNVQTHIYTIFVYNQILLRKKDKVENILHDLKFTSANPEVLDTLGRIEQGKIDNEPEAAEFLEKVGVRYLQQFYIHNSNLLTDDDY